jgi:hypothetical protein
MSSKSSMSTNVKIAVIVLQVVNIILTVYYNYKENYDECVRVDYDLTIKKLDRSDHSEYSRSHHSKHSKHSQHSPPKRFHSESETF